MIFEMPSRSAACFIAFILFWFACATYERTRSSAPVTGVQAEMKWMADSTQPEQDLSATADRLHPDDSTAQSQVECGADSPEWVQYLPDPRVPALAMAQPRPHRVATWRAPTLDGLQRPPRGSLPTA